MKSAPIVSKIHGSPRRRVQKRNSSLPSLFFFLFPREREIHSTYTWWCTSRRERRRHPPRKTANPRPDVRTQCLDSSSRSTAYTRCMCTRARAQRLAVSMRGSNLIPGKRPSEPPTAAPFPATSLSLPLYLSTPFLHLCVCATSNFLPLH